MSNNEVIGTLAIGDKNRSHVINFPQEDVEDTAKGLRSSTAKAMICFAFVGLMSSPIVRIIDVSNTVIKIKMHIKINPDNADNQIAKVHIAMDLDDDVNNAIICKVLSQNLKLIGTILETLG